jgi:hypothetical protein
MTGRTFRVHAQTVVERELARRHGVLSAFPPDSRAAVEDVAARTAVAVVDAIFDQARGEPALAAALASLDEPSNVVLGLAVAD